MADFWTSAGMQLVERDERGWLKATPEYLRAYLKRPEIHPIEESCDEEIRLFDDLLEDPFREVTAARLDSLADKDAADNYRVFLTFRDHLQESGTIEGAYMRLMQSGTVNIPPMFIDQMAHLITRNILNDCTDPIRLRSAEVFFREQTVNTDKGQIMLADEEIVSLYAENQASGGFTSLAQLVEDAQGTQKTHELDVLSEDNKEIYWSRSDRFDTVIDFRFTQPALDGFARVIEAWINHFLSLKVRVQPVQKIEDLTASWHIGLDKEASEILNTLYRGETLPFETAERIIALFKMEILEEEMIKPDFRGRPVFLGLAMTQGKRIRMKPQNLLANLPLLAGS